MYFYTIKKTTFVIYESRLFADPVFLYMDVKLSIFPEKARFTITHFFSSLFFYSNAYRLLHFCSVFGRCFCLLGLEAVSFFL